MGRNINIAFLWHMHQPPYEEPGAGVFLLPWTWLHATKDYFDMGEVIRRHPKIRVNMNFTPILLYQLDQYAREAIPDQMMLVMAKDPDRLTLADREFLLRTCFCVNLDTMGIPFPRYRQLHDMFRAWGDPAEAAANFRPEDYQDLSVLFLLAWCGPTLQAHPDIVELTKKARGYTNEDRETVLRLGRELIRRIVPLYKKLAKAGCVEMSTSPFFHPLTPLVVDNSCASESNPGSKLPYLRFSAPEEAERQIASGLDYFEKVFGFRPKGMWPPEGAVSEQAVAMYSQHGVKWLATDEEILHRSLGGEATLEERLHPHRVNGTSIFFRDRVLSDHIGFVYSRWPRETSVRHFMDALKRYSDAAVDDSTLVLVALDGENAWEFYPDGGFPFIDALYQAVEESGFTVPVTLSEYLEKFGPGERLEQLATGSWVGGTLDTWIGDPVKNRAWSMLSAAYQVVRDVREQDSGIRRLTDLAPANSPLLRAEASDWFWWFGKGHSSIHEREFDFLFRQNLRKVYESVGAPVPDQLNRPVDSNRADLPVSEPTAFISPDITGRQEGYYKWLGAGVCEFSHGSIHRLQPIISAVRFGFDATRLFFRVDGFEPLASALEGDGWLRVQFAVPTQCSLLIRPGKDGLVIDKVSGKINEGRVVAARAAVGDMLELAVPVSFFDPFTATPMHVKFHVVLGKGKLEVERFPWDSTVGFVFDPETFEVANWFV